MSGVDWGMRIVNYKTFGGKAKTANLTVKRVVQYALKYCTVLAYKVDLDVDDEDIGKIEPAKRRKFDRVLFRGYEHIVRREAPTTEKKVDVATAVVVMVRQEVLSNHLDAERANGC